MHTINVIDVNEALPRALAYLRDAGEPETTRNGPARVAPGPVATVYREPRRRVLFDAERDANPFFHLFEALWVLAGRQDVRTLAWFNSRIAGYSDDCNVFHAPYGHRLRNAQGFDQLNTVCKMLKENPYSRQAVLQIWDAKLDLNVPSVDIPCNDIVMLRVRDQQTSFHTSKRVLDITVCCRSNDAIWGAYGANAVQFSFLQEYIAGRINVGVGEYTQMSHNLHVYTDNPYWKTWMEKFGNGGVLVPDNVYDYSPGMVTSPLDGLGNGQFVMDLAALFAQADASSNLHEFCRGLLENLDFKTYFFQEVVRPMLASYHYRDKTDRLLKGSAYDWHYAGWHWLERRAKAAAAKAKEAAC